MEQSESSNSKVNLKLDLLFILILKQSKLANCRSELFSTNPSLELWKEKGHDLELSGHAYK